MIDQRTVIKPLQRTYSNTSIYIVTDDEIITEDGLLLTHEQAINSMPWKQYPKNVFVTGTNLAPFLAKVVDQWECFTDFFNLIAKPTYREVLNKGNEKQRRIIAVVPSYFGFYEWTDNRHKRYKQIHHLFDPLQFLSNHASAVTHLHDACTDPYKLLTLIKAYRKICKELDIPMTNSASHFGSMMLRHRKFFPDTRYKVSRHVNKVAAQAKVGQHEWRANRRAKRTIVMALDQRRAHHTCASEMVFPHSDTLRLRGNHYDMETPFKDIKAYRNYHGILYINITIPENTPEGTPQFPELQHKGTFNIWIATNEVNAWISCGAQINYVICSIATKQIDRGLNYYATYVRSILDKPQPSYVSTFTKMLYFRAYGLLGMRPIRTEKFYLHCHTDHQCEVKQEHLGHDLILPMHHHGSDYEREPVYVNQVWRAMLEREARKRVIMEARRLHFEKGKYIVGIYADSIYVKWPYLIESNETVWSAHREEVSFLDRSMYEHTSGKLIAPGLTGQTRERLIWQAQKLPLET